MNIILDSLPYIDRDYDDPERHKLVHSLIQDIIDKDDKQDIIIPSEYPLFQNNQFLNSELNRLINKDILNQEGIDLKRYTIPSPSNINDLNQWEISVNNAKVQLLHQYNRLENLQILQKYGINAWKLHTFLLNQHNFHLDTLINSSSNIRDDINKQRKSLQLKASRRLETLEKQWAELIGNNLQLELVNAELESQIKELRAQKDHKLKS